MTSSGRTGDALVPDGEPQTVAFTVANPSTGTLNLVTVVVTVANSDGSEWIDVDGCSAADYLVDNLIVGYGIVAGGSDVDGTVDVAMIDTGVNQDACKGVQVPLYFAAS